MLKITTKEQYDALMEAAWLVPVTPIRIVPATAREKLNRRIKDGFMRSDKRS